MRISDWSSDVCSSDLQAAFVDYGGNRHGFLAFSEIHPDYYQIPKEDREALLAEEAEHAAEEAAPRAEAEDAEAAGDVEELAAPASLDEEDNGESRDDHEGAGEAKIGRAAWRERVCQEG